MMKKITDLAMIDVGKGSRFNKSFSTIRQNYFLQFINVKE
jgi:hypothetical protein